MDEVDQKVIEDLHQPCTIRIEEHVQEGVEGVEKVYIDDQQLGFIDIPLSSDQTNLLIQFIQTTHYLCMKEAKQAYIEGLSKGRKEGLNMMNEVIEEMKKDIEERKAKKK